MSDKQPAAQGEAPHKKGAPILPIIGVVLILNMVMVGKIFMGGSGGGAAKENKAEKHEEIVGVKMPLEEFLVNLAGSNDHYLKATLSLGLRKGETEEKLKEEVAPIRDSILSILTTKQPEDLATEAGKEKLKKELVEKINKEIGGDKVVKVYFMSFATQ